VTAFSEPEEEEDDDDDDDNSDYSGEAPADYKCNEEMLPSAGWLKAGWLKSIASLRLTIF